MDKRTPVTESVVTVIYIDGGQRDYVISASPSVSTYLAKVAGETGILHLFNESIGESLSIPIRDNVREWFVRANEKGD